MPRGISLFFLILALAGAAQKKPVTLDDIGPPPGGVSGAIVWAPSADQFALNEEGWLSVYDVVSRKQHRVISIRALESASAKPVTDSSVTLWTNRRVTEHPLQWFADNRHLLVLAAGDLFIVDTGKGSFEPLLQTPETEHDPKLSPDNRNVSFRRGHDLYVVDTKTKAVTRLTSDGSDTLLNGETDWVYPEELDLGTAHWWAPDSRSIAYLQFDVSREPLFPQVNLLSTHGEAEPERYPKAGDANAGVRLGIVPVTGGVTKWMDLGSTSDNLFARVVWSPNSREVLAERLNRIQNRLDLLLADINTGVARNILREQDKFWINLRNDPRFLDDGAAFLWNSERTGFNHLYIYGIDGRQRAQLTSGDWEVDKIVAVDEQKQRVFYTSTEAGPMEKQLYSVAFDGSARQKISASAGTHKASFSAGCAYYMDDFSNLATPERSVIYAAAGRQVAVYRDSAGADIDRYALQPVEPISVKAADGTTLLAHLIRPAGFDASQKYPAVVMVYGGPDEQAVTNTFAGVSWSQAMARRGFVVWQLDNRGSTGRGHAFETVIYHNLGAHELSDQKDGIQYLISLGFVDPARIGMYGWSYGGFLTLYTITHAPGLIKAAIAGGPVADWHNYDSIYTERYMGLPADNEAAYRASAPVESAAALAGTKLLILHNIEDDNVHFQNSVQMAAALEKAGKTFFMVVYPENTHEVTGPPARQLSEETAKFFEDNLK